MAGLTFTPAAWHDLDQQLEYLWQQGGLALATRFLNGVAASTGLLAASPRVGARCGFEGRNRSVRRWAVKGFEDWLLFYRIRRNSVEVLRILHGARRIDELLAP